MFSNLQTKSENRNSMQPRKSRKSSESGSKSNGSSSDNENHASRRTNRRDTQECYRWHMVGHIA